jgi:hypothetical protein
MTKVLLRILLATVVGFTATVAKADTMTVSASISGQTLSVSGVNLDVSKFDTSLGTLNSVQITLNGSVDFYVVIRNYGTNAVSITSSPKGQLNLYYSDSSSMVSTYTNSNDFTFSLSAHSLRGIDLSASIDPAVTTLTSGAEFDAFKGTGTCSFLTDITDLSSVTGSGNINFQAYRRGGDSVSVTYDYTPTSSVPEPSTAVTAAIGVVVCGLVQRLRRRARA